MPHHNPLSCPANGPSRDFDGWKSKTYNPIRRTRQKGKQTMKYEPKPKETELDEDDRADEEEGDLSEDAGRRDYKDWPSSFWGNGWKRMGGEL